eukprot:CAMPEP_0205804290 /NCGR_PEP_ID=MMETSP0205-20121125/7166_1 /ASSEMBLY_ACC=CAM_ASM_000278 /TAXON_ID=36767 /ORGANISM="Euplotes focardii, Strain TN1" /LENGTH=168 /DNA_ID=CAMNT_0053073665 /DNA_START=701 /DNA_END=1204 /DNA_ORIENTATION=+
MDEYTGRHRNEKEGRKEKKERKERNEYYGQVKDQDEEEEKYEDLVADNNQEEYEPEDQETQIKIFLVDDNLYCGEFPAEESEMNQLRSLGINAAFCISKESNNDEDDEYLPDENVQHLIFMNKENVTFSKICIQKFPEKSKNKSFARKFKLSTNEIKSLREKDGLNVI